MRTAYVNARIYTGGEVETGKAILVEDGIVHDLVDIGAIEDASIINLEGLNIAPAFIDMQIYGGNGKMFSQELSIEALDATYQYSRAGGASHFMITLATNSIAKFLKGIEVAAAYMEENRKGLLGVHLEGPYINKVKKGAHIEEFIKTPVSEEIELLLGAGPGVFRMMTLAPEQCDPMLVKFLLSQGIIVSAGHTNATYEEAMKAFDLGIPAATHLFNAMSAFQSREPGMVGAIYDHAGVVSSIVCDGVHVHYPAVRISKQIMKERLFYITDAVAEVKDGDYPHLYCGDRFTLPDGTLSGSALTMMQCVKNGIEHANISLEESLRMASTYPARLLQPSKKLGMIAPGYEAKFVVFDDELNVREVID